MTGTEHPTPELPDADGDQTVVLGHVRHADVVFLAWLDNWIDKSIHDGTLTPAKASAYREAIAARCAQLGEVPNIVGAVQRLDAKPGDTVVVISPVDSTWYVHELHRQVTAFFKDTGIQAIAVPPGTEIKVLHPGPRSYDYPVGGFSPVPPYVDYGPAWPEPGTPEYDAIKARAEVLAEHRHGLLRQNPPQDVGLPPFKQEP